MINFSSCMTITIVLLSNNKLFCCSTLLKEGLTLYYQVE
jgi:hypothetical protein